MAKPFLLCYHVDGKKYEGIKVGIQGSQTEKNLQKAFDIVSKRRSEYSGTGGLIQKNRQL